MKKRLSTGLLSLGIAVILCACGGGGGDSNGIKVEEETPAAEVAAPDADSSDFLDEFEDDGIAQDMDVRTEMQEEADAGNDPAETQGIYLLEFFIGSANAGVREVKSTIYCVNPDTGQQCEAAYFNVSIPDVSWYAKGDYYYQMPGPPKNSNQYADYYTSNYRELFSSDYSKMAMTKVLVSTGEVRAGWIDTDGNFFDVTETVGVTPKSDFDDSRYFYAVGFTPDDLFVYYEYTSGNEYIPYYVAVDELSGTQQGDPFEEAYLIRFNTTIMNNVRLSDWIDETHFLADSGSVCYIVDTETKESNKYIPGDSRTNWNGVASPDASQIAFLSQIGTTADIYITSIDGGEPVKVDCESPMGTSGYFSGSGAVLLYLLDWK